MGAVMALFQSETDAELAVSELSLIGFTEKDVAMVIFSAVAQPKPGGSGLLGWLARGGLLGDTMDRTDGVSVMDGTSVAAVFGGVLGIVFGSRWVYGPVTLGTLGMLGGGLLGFLIDRLIPEKRRDEYESSLIPGMILLEVSSSAADRLEAASRVLKRRGAKQLAMLPEHDANT